MEIFVALEHFIAFCEGVGKMVEDIISSVTDDNDNNESIED